MSGTAQFLSILFTGKARNTPIAANACISQGLEG